MEGSLFSKLLVELRSDVFELVLKGVIIDTDLRVTLLERAHLLAFMATC